jgi:hypothetical protein
MLGLNNMINLKKQSFGDEILVEISGDDRNNVVRQFWSFWNHQATNGEFIWTNDGFGDKYCGYFWTDTGRLKQCCENIELNKLAGVDGEITPQLEEYSKISGESFFNSITNESFYRIVPDGIGGYKLVDNVVKEDTIETTTNNNE